MNHNFQALKTTSKVLLLGGYTTFVISLFMPAYIIDSSIRKFDGSVGPLSVNFTGLMSLFMSLWFGLLPPYHHMDQDKLNFMLPGVANLIVLIAPFVIANRLRKIEILFSIILVITFFFDLTFSSGSDKPAFGSYLWLSSHILIAAGLSLHALTRSHPEHGR